jgi:hypothetical protein
MKARQATANTDHALSRGLGLVARRIAAEFEREHEKSVRRIYNLRPRLRHEQ